MTHLVLLSAAVSTYLRARAIPPQPVGGYTIWNENNPCQSRFWPDWTAFPKGWSIYPPPGCGVRNAARTRK